MRVLVFGKTGQVAQELIALGGDQVTALGRDQADLGDPAACAAQITGLSPDVVINAAAYTAVDRAEDDEDFATVVNGYAPGAMARACAALDIPFLHISTDYVFDGTGGAARLPTDSTSPINAYGRSKLAGEKAVMASGARSVILRTSWVFSSHGANFVKTMLRLAETRDALNVVDDQIGGPTSARDIAATLLAIAPQMVAGHRGGVYQLAGQPAVSWAEFAREIFAQSGKDVDVNGIPSRDYPTPAPRPLNSRMACDALTQDFGVDIPDWRASLADVLSALRA